MVMEAVSNQTYMEIYTIVKCVSLLSVDPVGLVNDHDESYLYQQRACQYTNPDQRWS